MNSNSNTFYGTFLFLADLLNSCEYLAWIFHVWMYIGGLICNSPYDICSSRCWRFFLLIPPCRSLRRGSNVELSRRVAGESSPTAGIPCEKIYTKTLICSSKLYNSFKSEVGRKIRTAILMFDLLMHILMYKKGAVDWLIDRTIHCNNLYHWTVIIPREFTQGIINCRALFQFPPFGANPLYF